MDKFLGRYNLLRLNQDETEKMKGPITRTEMETVIKKLPTDKSPGPDGFTGQFYQTFSDNTYPYETIPKKSQRKGHLQAYSMRPPSSYTKTGQRCHKKRKPQANFTDEHRCKNPQQNTSKLHPTIH